MKQGRMQPSRATQASRQPIPYRVQARVGVRVRVRVRVRIRVREPLRLRQEPFLTDCCGLLVEIENLRLESGLRLCRVPKNRR